MASNKRRLSNKEINHVQESPTILAAQHVSYKGPIPPPEVFAALQEISPDLVDRVMSLAEREQARSIDEASKELALQDKAMDYEHQENRLSLWLAFGACLLFLTTGVVLIFHGYEITGSIFAGAPLVSIVGSFLRNIGREKKNIPHK